MRAPAPRAGRARPRRLPPAAAALAAAALGLVPAARLSAQPAGGLRVDVSAGAETGSITNPRFAGAGDSSDVVSRARAAVVASRRWARTGLTSSAAGGWQRFRSAKSLSQFTYSLAGDAERRVTPRLTARAGLTAASLLSRGGAVPVFPAAGAAGPDAGAPDAVAPNGTAPDAAAPDASGVAGGLLPLLPLALTRNDAAAAGVRYLASPRTTLAAGGGVSRTRFATPGLVGGTALQAEASATRLLTARTSVALALAADRLSVGGAPLATQTTSLGWSVGGLRGGVQLRLSAGASRYTQPAGPPRAGGVGAADVGGRAGRGQWGLRVAHQVTPVFGVPQILTADEAGATYARAVPGGLVARLGFSQSWLRATAAPLGRLVTTAATAELQRPIAAGLWAGVAGSRFSRAQAGTVQSRDLTLRVGYAASLGAGPSRRGTRTP